jgi:hypothetical protein
MQRTWDAKSLVVGLMLGLLVAFGLGATQAIPPGPRPIVDRFEIETGDTGRAYVLDTATGQVWQIGNEGFNKPKLDQGH